jgi:hypothetical protein
MQPGNMKRLYTSRRNTIPPTILCALLAMACASCTGRADNSINVSGSTSVSPFVEHLAERFQKAHAGSAINVQSLGSTAGIQAAISAIEARRIEIECLNRLNQALTIVWPNAREAREQRRPGPPFERADIHVHTSYDRCRAGAGRGT